MHNILIANPKGGSGKSTLATNLAGYFASSGGRVMLGDIDRQHSSLGWLQRRPAHMPLIRGWEVDADESARPPKDTTHVILDTPAGLHGKKLHRVLEKLDHIIIPLQPSIFDMLATQTFLEALLEEKAVQKYQTKIAVVGMRVDERTRAYQELARFAATLKVPVVTVLRDTQLYVRAAAHGLSIFDLTPSTVDRDLRQWEPLIEWLALPPLTFASQ